MSTPFPGPSEPAPSPSSPSRGEPGHLGSPGAHDAPRAGRARRVAGAAAWVVTGAVAASALTGVAVAGTRTPAASSTGGAATTVSDLVPAADASAAGAARRGPRARLIRSLLHGEVTVARPSGPVDIALQRGTVTAASASSVTLRSSDGFTATYTIGPDTVVRRDRATVDGAALQPGDVAFVRATGTTADAVRALSPDAASRLRDRRAAGGGAGAAGGGTGPATGAAPTSPAA
ncbi:MAG: hypothetical protein GC157_04365 [Frankiales bacterium]|nr:hypothetical protein [Frankiales bacterium]